MAARSGLQALEAQIARDGGDDEVFDRFRSGEKISEIMESYGFSRGMFYNWLKAGGDERRAAYEAAKIDSADAYVEKAEDTLTDPRLNTAPTSAEVSLAGSKAKFYQWLAGKRNRAAYGDDPLVAVHNNMSVGELHLSALIEGGLTPLEPESAPDEIVEAEVLSIEPGEPATPDATDEFEADPVLAELLEA